MTRQAAYELGAHGITVNAVMPGGVITRGGMASTGLVPATDRELGRCMEPPVGQATPDDIGQAVLFLASGAAGRITGHALAVDGGTLLG